MRVKDGDFFAELSGFIEVRAGGALDACLRSVIVVGVRRTAVAFAIFLEGSVDRTALALLLA